MTVAIGATALWGPATVAHETDQFTTPPDGQRLVDVGPFLNDYFVSRLQEAVDDANRQIERSLKGHSTTVRRARTASKIRALRSTSHRTAQDTLARIQTPEGITAEYRDTFLPGPWLIEKTEKMIRRNKKLKAQNPGMLTLYKPGNFNSVFMATDPMPVSVIARLWFAATINAYGTHFGTDKLGHFIHFGYDMYVVYRRHIRSGKSPEEAMRLATLSNVDGAGGEKGIFGQITVGSYSNADLASNHVGCLFFRNVTEPVILKGELSPPMLERNGPYWKISDHVLSDPNFFARYISDHYNESLNPSMYRPGMRKQLRKNVQKRHEALLQWYAGPDGATRPKTWFDNKLEELSTYYGADYGHRGTYEELVSIGSTWPTEQ